MPVYSKGEINDRTFTRNCSGAWGSCFRCNFTYRLCLYCFGKIPKVTIALLGAAITILLGLVSQSKLVDGAINAHYFINFVDFNVIFLLVSMMIIVSIATRSGMFNWIANELLRLTKGHPKLVLFTLGIFTAVTSAFLDNVTTVILIMPVTFLSQSNSI